MKVRILKCLVAAQNSDCFMACFPTELQRYQKTSNHPIAIKCHLVLSFHLFFDGLSLRSQYLDIKEVNLRRYHRANDDCRHYGQMKYVLHARVKDSH